MTEIADIQDRDSLQAWLEKTNQSRAACVWIAHRAAMRVLPVYWHWIATSGVARERELTVLPVLRASLLSGVAEVVPTPESSAARADTAAHAANVAADAAARAAADAAAFAAFAVRAAPNAANAAHAAHAAADAAADAANAADAALKADCQTLADRDGIPPQSTPSLWPSEKNPFETEWTVVANTRPANWGFWVTWYTRALQGTETRWDLLERIALSNLEPRADGEPREPEEYAPFWTGSDAEVNARIQAVVEQLELRAEIAALKAERETLHPQAASVAHRSHNTPSEVIGMPAEASERIVLVYEQLDEAENELEKWQPDWARLRWLATAILDGAKYIWSVCDAGIKAVAKAAGAAGGALVVNHLSDGRLIEFGERLLKLASSALN